MEEYTLIFNEQFPVFDDFSAKVRDYLTTYMNNADYNFYNENNQNNLLIFGYKLIAYLIYDYYAEDKLAYLDYNIFVKRLSQDIIYNMTKYYNKYNLVKILTDLEISSRYDDTSSLNSGVDEKSNNSGNVVQSSADTPPTIKTNTNDKLSINLTDNNNKVETDNDNTGYADKYTNTQSKTNSLNVNDLKRETIMKRKGNIKNIYEIINQLPKSLYNEILTDFSKHFIIVYE